MLPPPDYLYIGTREEVDEQVEKLDEQTARSPKEGKEGEVRLREEK